MPRPATRFADQVASYFDLWDDDGDGVLSFQETGRRVPDTSIRDEAAAALAAIHLIQRFQQWEHAAFSRAELMAPPDHATGHVPPFKNLLRRMLCAHPAPAGRVLFEGDALKPAFVPPEACSATAISWPHWGP